LTLITLRRAWLDHALERAKPHMRGDVLDVGGRKENRRGDFRPPVEAVSSWRFLNPDASSRPDFLGVAERIPLPDASVDTALMMEVIEYLADPGRALDEIRRVLRPGGTCLLSSPLLMAIHGDSGGDRQRFTRLRLIELAEGAGFAVESAEGLGSLGSVLHDLLHAALGYAAGHPQGRPWSLARRLLAVSVPLFRWLDRRSARQSGHINTGYFLVLRKP
jgi:SAM-dependent methyltransferase